MAIHERFVIVAESLVDVRFVTHGRDPAIDLDCVGHVLVSAERTGVRFNDGAHALVPGVDLLSPMYARTRRLSLLERLSADGLVTTEDAGPIGDVSAWVAEIRSHAEPWEAMALCS